MIIQSGKLLQKSLLEKQSASPVVHYNYTESITELAYSSDVFNLFWKSFCNFTGEWQICSSLEIKWHWNPNWYGGVREGTLVFFASLKCKLEESSYYVSCKWIYKSLSRSVFLVATYLSFKKIFSIIFQPQKNPELERCVFHL